VAFTELTVFALLRHWHLQLFAKVVHVRPPGHVPLHAGNVLPHDRSVVLVVEAPGCVVLVIVIDVVVVGRGRPGREVVVELLVLVVVGREVDELVDVAVDEVLVVEVVLLVDVLLVVSVVEVDDDVVVDDEDDDVVVVDSVVLVEELVLLVVELLVVVVVSGSGANSNAPMSQRPSGLGCGRSTPR